MTIGGFDTLTEEQQAKCLLLGIWLVHEPKGWIIVKNSEPISILSIGNAIEYFADVESAITIFTTERDSYTWM